VGSQNQVDRGEGYVLSEAIGRREGEDPSFRLSVLRQVAVIGTLPYYLIVSSKSIRARQAGALLMYVKLEFP